MTSENILTKLVSVIMVASGAYPLARIIMGRDFGAVVLIVFSLLFILCGAGLLLRKKWARRWSNILLFLVLMIVLLSTVDHSPRYSYNERLQYYVIVCLYVFSLAVLNLPSVKKQF